MWAGRRRLCNYGIAGMMIEPQVGLAILFLLLTAWGYLLARRPAAR